MIRAPKRRGNTGTSRIPKAVRVAGTVLGGGALEEALSLEAMARTTIPHCLVLDSEVPIVPLFPACFALGKALVREGAAPSIPGTTVVTLTR